MTTIKVFAGVLIIGLAGCGTTSGPSPAALLYATSAGLDQAEVGATAYLTSPLADPATKTEIKHLDNIACGAVHPVLDAATRGGSPVTAAEAQAAQAALGAFTDYLVSKGVH